MIDAADETTDAPLRAAEAQGAVDAPLPAAADAPLRAASPSGAEPTDAELLRQLWRETLKALLQELRSGEAKASAIAVSRSFLDSNGVSLESLDKLEGKTPGGALEALGPMLARLPSFND